MYFTDRGIDELEGQRGEDQVSLAWLAQRFREFIDLNPESETAVRPAGRLAGGGQRRRVTDCTIVLKVDFRRTRYIVCFEPPRAGLIAGLRAVRATEGFA